jgi:hypothetical protein
MENKMRKLLLLLAVTFWAAVPVVAQVNIGVSIGMPSVNIGINFPVFPQFAPVPGYPVYYAPQLDANYFFYDGMYWVYQGDNWYASSWYNGPWAMVAPVVVPVFILRVPVSYYRQPPGYFRGWRPDAPPRWGDHWGNDWQRQRNGWDKWNHSSAPAAAPLPTYQKQYSGSRYPSYQEQRTITTQNYHYQPHEPVVRQHYQQFVNSKGSAAPQEGRPPPQHSEKASAKDRPAPASEGVASGAPQRDSQSPPPRPQHPPAPPPPQPTAKDRPPSAQGEHAPKQPETAGQEHGSQGPGENDISKEPKKEPNKDEKNKDEGGDRVQDKESPRDSR